MVINEGRDIGVTLQLIDNSLVPETEATVTYKIFDSTGNEVVSKQSAIYNEITQSYIDSLSVSASWINQKPGCYFLVWSVSGAIDSFQSVYTEPLQITIDDTKIDRILGLVQENYHIDQAQYNSIGCMTSGRIRTYSDDSSVGTNNNILATYTMTAEYDVQGRMTTYKVEKI